MSTAACLNINTLNINNSNSISWHNTTLIQVKSKLFFSSLFIFKILANRMSFQDNLISLILNLHFRLFTNRLIMRDINMSIMFSLFRTMLPNMRTENSSCSSIYNVSTSMETDKSVSSFLINLSYNFFANNSLRINFLVQVMQETLSNLINIVNFIIFSSNVNASDIINLTS